uniref:t-SNARE coiled-coil homology domain-containing protein n=1 Tax=Mucochytrium quahogii TaxID=96639 RepID=A0A7S2WS45_9STRA
MAGRETELFGRARGGGRKSQFDDDDADEGDTFLQQRRMEEQQDEHLDAIGETLKRVGQMAHGFGEELRAQNDLLDEVDSDMQRTQGAMKMVEGKTQQLVEKAGGPGWFCLTVALGCLAFFLFLLIIYT